MPDTTAPRWRWLPGAARYYDFTAHRFVAAKVVRAWGWEAISASRDRATAAAEMVADGRIDTAMWQGWMRAEIKREYIRQYVLGKGGLSAMNNKDWSSIGGMLREQYKYLDGFVAEVAAGGLSQGAIAARSRMYLNSATESYWRATERATGMPPLPCYPGDGSSVCKTNDRCYWDIKPIGKAGSVTGWRCFWKLTPADHCTSDDLVEGHDGSQIPAGCLQRAARWNPLTLWLPGHEPGAARKALAAGAKYAVDQPRVPAGQATGGQFASTAGAAATGAGATTAFESERMVHKLQDIGGVRWQITSQLKPESENWLDQAAIEKDAVWLTVELPTLERPYAYLNRIDALKQHRGLAREALRSTLGLLRQRGVTETRSYVEHGNDASESMLTRLGWRIIERKEQGNVWGIHTPQARKALASAAKGGPGSGNFGHAGRPGLVGSSAPASSRPTAFEDAARTGKTTSDKELGGGVTQSYLETYAGDGSGVWKAVAQEEGTDAEGHNGHREVAAYRLDQLLGLNVVPPTVYAKRDGVMGTSQQWIDDLTLGNDLLNDSLRHSYRDVALDDFENAIMLDTLLQNDDRHWGNWGVDAQGKLWAIDHGHAGFVTAPTRDVDLLNAQGTRGATVPCAQMWSESLDSYVRNSHSTKNPGGGKNHYVNWLPGFYADGRLAPGTAHGWQISPAKLARWRAIDESQFRQAFAGVSTQPAGAASGVDVDAAWHNLQLLLAVGRITWY